MKVFGLGGLGIFLLSLGGAASAESTLRTRIYAVYPAPSAPEAHQVLSTEDGRVYDVAFEQEALLVRLQQAVASRELVDLTISEDGISVLAVRSAPREAWVDYTDEFLEAEMAEIVRTSRDPEVEKLLFPMPQWFRPTVLASRADANRLYQSLYRNTAGNSQCFQRANYWAYNLFLYDGVRSMKAFLFFSNAYRYLDPDKPEMYRALGFTPAREGAPDHRWWFHVAPMVYVQEEDWSEPVEFVLDAGFPAVIRGPLRIKPWTDVFVDTHKACQVIASYSVRQADEDEWIRDRELYKRTLRDREHCWLRFVPMYYYQPADIERADRLGRPIHGWSSWALRNSECAVRRCGLF